MPEEKPGRSLRRKLLLILAINLGILVLLFLVLEVTFRIIGYPFSGDWVPTENGVARFDPELGWTYLPDISRTLVFNDRRLEMHFDKDGIRVPGPNHRFRPDKPSVLFIGGSYTMGHGLPFEETFPHQFGVSTGGRYQVVNLGVQAYGTDQALLTLRKHLKKFNTRVVVYTFFERHLLRNGIRDRRLLIPNARFLGTKPRFALDANGNPFLADRPVLYDDYWNSYVVDFLKLSIGPRLRLFPPFPEELTMALIREMNEYCGEHGVTFIMLNWRWSGRGYDNFGDLGIEVVDTLSHAPRLWPQMRIPGDGHPDAAACRVVAEMLHYVFRSKRLL